VLVVALPVGGDGRGEMWDVEYVGKGERVRVEREEERG
jgi:hypothetical protein